MKTFQKPEMEIVMIEVADIICESVEYGEVYFDNKGDDFIGWG